MNEDMKRILIINASPRRRGGIDRMLTIIEDEARALGADVETVRISQLTIAACTGCMVCRKKLACILPEDGAQSTLGKIKASDVLVIGAPCYWGNMPGTLKLLFDRIVYGMMDEDKRGIPVALHKGKQAVIISSCTTVWPFNILFHQSRGVVRALKEILKWSGFRIIATMEKGGTKNHPDLKEVERRKCIRIAKKIAI
ncbi:NADPH-dependent FMN reductase [Prevotella sp. kh1p2]|nr:NADPH-dependent FMN reductase [Prevotella sp. kh1p2]SNU10451.1 NADPH-dependent FMN reductase [Prevotellaceae bacterium KH2P17]